MNCYVRVVFGIIILLGVSTTTLLHRSALLNPKIHKPWYFSKKYNQVTFLGTHNSYSSKPEFAYGVLNQFSNITTQLEGGVGVFDLEVHHSSYVLRQLNNNDDIRTFSSSLLVCHGPLLFSSLTGSTTLLYQMHQIEKWISANPERIITVYINFMGGLEKHKNANDLVIADFISSGLDKRVWSYNVNTGPEYDKWPLLGEMIIKRKTVMVFGLNGIQNFKENQNYFISNSSGSIEEENELSYFTSYSYWDISRSPHNKKDDNQQGKNVGGKWIPAWNAKTVSEVQRSTQWPLFPKPLDQNGRLYLMNAFASPRNLFWDFPYIFGGNPYTAAKVNPIVSSLLKENQNILKARGEGSRVNFVWVDFWTLVDFPESVVKDGIFVL